MSNLGQIDAFLWTDIGRKRENNQDFVADWQPSSLDEEKEHGWLFLVADGVGGADAGDVASRYASQRTIQHYLDHVENEDWGERLKSAMKAANTDLRQYVAELGENSRMATTMVAAVLQGSEVYMSNVGDSRGYLIHDGVISQITKDQSLVAKLVEEGAISLEEAKEHPHGNIILSSLGSEINPQIDLFNFTLTPGDVLILCSDGLTKYVDDKEIAQALQLESAEKSARKLIAMANERGGADNISVAIIRYFPQKTAEFKVKSLNQKQKEGISRKSQTLLWGYTLLLSLVQTLFIFLVWIFLRV